MIIKTTKKELETKSISEVYIDNMFKIAKQNGISKYAVAKRMYKDNLHILYHLKNPTVKTLERVRLTIEELIKEKQNASNSKQY